jgi:uncharacterized protein YndB with AHSA1/START domain
MGETSFQPDPAKARTKVERGSDRELVMTRVFKAPPRIVFDAWTKSELFQLWWAPKSSPVPMLSCEMDVRVGGGYSVTFGHDAAQAMTFFGKYLEVDPPSRLVWSNEEGDDISITTVTFEDQDGQTLLVMTELYPSKEALDASYVGMECGTPEQFEQLDDLLVTLAKEA